MKTGSLGHEDSVLPPKEGLATPHFDERAIAAARPVQPLSHRTLPPLYLAGAPRKVAVVATVILLVGLSIATTRHDDRANSSGAKVELEADSQPAAEVQVTQPLESRAPTIRPDRQSSRLPRLRYESLTPGFVPGSSKPVAPKVGEIRSSGRLQ